MLHDHKKMKRRKISTAAGEEQVISTAPWPITCDVNTVKQIQYRNYTYNHKAFPNFVHVYMQQ